MRNKKIANKYLGERLGQKKFYPLVASSLALALGVSVGNALPVLTDTTNGANTVINPTSGTIDSIWTTTNDGLDYYKFANDDNNKSIYFSVDSGNSPFYQWKTGDANELQIGGMRDFTLSADKGISMNGGAGTLTISMWLGSGRPANTFTLDLSSIRSDLFAIRGNLTIDRTTNDSANNTFVALLGGKGIYGMLNLQTSGTSNLTFTNDTSKIGGISASSGTTNINSNDLEIGGINVSNGTTSIISNDLTISKSGDAIVTSGGILNITADNLTIRAGASGIWSSNGSQFNITIRDNGSFSTYKNNTSTLANISIDKTSQFTMNFEGNATINSIFQGNNVNTNTITMNFGSSASNNTDSHNVVFKGSFNNNINNGFDKPFTSIFNFQNDNFTFALQNASGVAQGITYSNTRSNAINFNANNGVFDLGTNALNVSGRLGINLGGTSTATTNTIKSSSITTSGSGATTIAFNADNSTLNLNENGNGTISTTGGTTAINFNGANGILNGAVNTDGGATTISIADSSSGAINGAVTTADGNTNINFNGANGILASNISTTGGTTAINFNGANGILNGAISTDGGATTISIADSSSGTINGSVSTPSASTTLATIVFASGSGDKSLRLGSGGNTIESITLGSTGASTNNSLILSSGLTVMSNETTITSGNGLSIVFENANTMFRNSIVNLGTANINFDGTDGLFMDDITTDDANAVTTINVFDGKSGEISGDIITAQGSTNISFGIGSNSKSLTLSGNSELTGITFGGDSTNNTLVIKGDTEITNTTDVGSNKGLVLALNSRRVELINNLSNSGGDLEVRFGADNTSLIGNTSTSAGTTSLNFNASGSITGSVSTTGGSTTIAIANGKSGSISEAVTTTGGSTNISFAEGSNAKSLTLSAGGNTLTGIAFGANSTANTLTLSTGSTSFDSAINVGENQALTFDLANDTTLTFSQGLLSNGGTSLFSVKDNASSTINGNITLDNGGANNVTIGNGGGSGSCADR